MIVFHASFFIIRIKSSMTATLAKLTAFDQVCLQTKNDSYLSKEKRKLQFNSVNHLDARGETKDNLKENISSNSYCSSLSLHIVAYENAIETVNTHGFTNSCFVKKQTNVSFKLFLIDVK